MNESHSRRSAIVISGWGWPTYNLLERAAIVLGRAGWRVLYCDNPASFLRKLGGKRTVLAENIEGFRPGILGQRLNSVPLVRGLQARLLVDQLLRQAADMGMETPMAIYGHGHWLPHTVRALKARGIPTVFLCMDRLESCEEEELAKISDRVLAIPPSVYHKLRARCGDKVLRLPQIGPDMGPHQRDNKPSQALARVTQLPRPRLGYLGPPSSRVHAGLLKELLAAHPEWHFVACGPVAGLTLPNLHNIGWIAPAELPSLADLFDVGLMPYDCSQDMNLHCVPLKLFDYFAAGLPVVSTPIIHSWDCRDLVYLGTTHGELADGIRRALSEAPDDPCRERRREIARAHSIEASTRTLPSILLDGAPEINGSAFQRRVPVRLPPLNISTCTDQTVKGPAEQRKELHTNREAIVLSGWAWNTSNVPERIAAALARAGWRVLYCENPASFVRRRKEEQFPIAERVQGFRPRFAGHRLNALPSGSRWQAKFLTRQIMRQAREMGFSRPIVIYPHGYWMVEVARELKSRDIPGVFVCMDHIERSEMESLAEASIATLAIPFTTFLKLKAKFGYKVHLLPQLGPDLDEAHATVVEPSTMARVEQIPHPRLAYFGPPTSRLHAGLLKSLLTAHPDWHFLVCGPTRNLQLPNIHDIGWIGSKEFPTISRATDIGFMPYDCGDEVNLHCVPLKLFDYFSEGLPVVSTPLIHLRQYEGLIYLGDSAEELAEGVRRALAEPPGDPRRQERRRIGRAHSIEMMSELLPAILLEALGQHLRGKSAAGENDKVLAKDELEIHPETLPSTGERA